MTSLRKAAGLGNGLRMRSLCHAKIVLFGLVVVIWFASLAKGAHDLWAVTAVCGWLSIVTIVFMADSYKNKNPISLPLSSHLFLLFFALLISSRFSYDINTTRLELWIYFLSILTFLLLFNSFRNQSSRFQFLRYGGIVIVPVTLIALAQYLDHPPYSLYSHGSEASTFTNSAVLAGYAISWVLIFWHFGRKDRAYRWLFAASLLTLFLARSWWSVISLLFGFTFYYKEQIKIALFLRRRWAIGIGFFVLGFLIVTARVKFGASLDSIESVTDRWNWWMVGIRMWHAHPLVGIGLGSYGTAFPFFRPHAMLNTLYAHSFPIQLLSETGLLGLASASLFLIAYVRLLLEENTVSKEFMAYRAAVISIFIYSLTTIYLEYFIGKLMLLMLMALTLSFRSEKSFVLSKRSFNLIVLGLVLAVPEWYLPFRASRYHVEGLREEAAGNTQQAELIFKKAILLNPYQDESYASLARIDQNRFVQSHSVLDLASSLLWTQESLNLRKIPTSRREIAE
jgi:O-antigen ligase